MRDILICVYTLLILTLPASFFIIASADILTVIISFAVSIVIALIFLILSIISENGD